MDERYKFDPILHCYRCEPLLPSIYKYTMNMTGLPCLATELWGSTRPTNFHMNIKIIEHKEFHLYQLRYYEY